jgi:uncharacterized protein YjbI with pentapeptide repeats
LQGVDLAGLMADSVDFSYSDLSAANLDGVIIQSANFYCANLNGVNLHGATINNADMIGVWLALSPSKDSADLGDAKMQHVHLDQAVLQKTILKGTDLTGADLYRSTINGPNINETTNLSSVCAIQTTMDPADFAKARNFADMIYVPAGKEPSASQQTECNERSSPKQ